MSDGNRPADINPYAPPSVLDPIARPDPGVGVWRDGGLVVAHRRAEFPRYCVETGEPAAGTRDCDVFWHGSGRVLSQAAYFAVPLRRDRLEAFARLRQRSRLGILLGGLLLVMAIVLALVTGYAAWMPLLVMLFIPLGLGGVAIGILAAINIRPPLRVVHSLGDYLWLDGPCRDFVERLPPWPYNR